MALLAKISRPIGRVIPRSAIISRILESPARLFWITAPAGSGKTSVGIGFAESLPARVAWLRLDPADSDPASFLHFLAESITHAGAAGEWCVPPLARERLPDLGAYLRRFLRSLASHWVEPAWLVLDDAHRCQEAPFFALLLGLMAEELPAGVRLLVLSRREPPPGCARLVAHQTLLEIPGSLLALSLAETEALLASLEVADPSLHSAPVHALTGGWAAGTALAAAWQKRRGSVPLRPEGPFMGLVSGYLAAEVFESLSPLEQRALLAVCRLPYFSGGWAAALTGEPEAAPALARLAEQGVLIYEYADRRYLLHRLLQHFLREQAQLHCTPEQRERWLSQSIELLAQAGCDDDAVELALEAGVHERALPLVERQSPGALAQARYETVARWVTSLPEGLRTGMLWHWLGAASIPVNPIAARTYHLAACAAFRAEGRPGLRLLSLNPVIRTYYLMAADAEPLPQLLARELADPGEYDTLANDELKAQMALCVFAGLAIADASHPELPLWEGRTLEWLRRAREPLYKAQAAVIHVHNDFLRGRYRRIQATRTALEAPPGLTGAHVYARHQAFAIQLYDELIRFDHAALASSFAESRTYAEESGVRFMEGHYAIDLATSLLIQGRAGEALALLEQVAAAVRPGQYNLAGHLHMIAGWAAAWAGESGRAREHAELLRRASAGFGERCPYAVSADILEAVVCALSEPARLPEALIPLRAADSAGGFPAAAIHADLLTAWAALERGDGAQARPFTAAALGRLAAESTGYLNFALPRLLQPVCAQAFEEGIESALVQRLVAGFRLTPPPDAGPAWPRPVEVRCFGGFELRVGGDPLASRGKSKHRQLDLLKLLAAHDPLPLPLARVAELLWPDSEGDTARHALETTLSRLRASLGADAIRLEHGQLSLVPEVCAADTRALDRLLTRIEAALAGDGAWASAAEAVLAIYRGDLLAGEQSPWLLARRDYWRGRVGRVLGECARAYAARGELPAAHSLLEHCLECDPGNESLTALFISLCVEAGRPAAGLGAYRSHRLALLSELGGAAVAPEIEALARRLKEIT